MPKATAPNAARALRFQIKRDWRGIGESRRSGLVWAALISLSLLLLMLNVNAAEPSHGVRDFSLLLQPIEVRVPAGTVPKFRVTLTNVSHHACRILNIEHRVDLQHVFYELIVTKGGEAVRLPGAFSDPDPISDSDFLYIRPGGTKTFILSNFPRAYNRLPPGDYQAYVRFWRDPRQSPTNAYRSETAKFTVTK